MAGSAIEKRALVHILSGLVSLSHARFLSVTMILIWGCLVGATPAPAQDIDPDLRQAVVTATEEFVEERRKSDYIAAWNMLTPGNQDQVPFDRFVDLETAAKDRLGPIRLFQVLRVTDYPERSDVAVDFAATYGGGVGGFFECGYFVWRRTDAGFKLARIERGSLPVAALESSQARANLEALRCQVLPRSILPIE